MRLIAGALFLVSAASCSLLDSVGGYAGPPSTGGTGAAGGTGGTDAAAATGGAAGDASTNDVAAPCVDVSECDDGNPCTDESCWGSLCKYTPKPGSSCSDGNVCNGDETCDGTGVCQPGTSLPLDDDNPCTDDSCDPTLGVQHTLQTSPVPVLVNCGTVTCPSGYYTSKLTCLSECGACNPTFCVNGVECTRICEKTLPVCCGNACGDDCPSGYTQQATSTTGECGCGAGLSATCVR
jgi:hypothetical protein